MTEHNDGSAESRPYSAEIVNEDARLNELCAEWSACEYLAVDTEFMRVNTFYPILALIQVGDGENEYLIDPLAITDTQALKTLFCDSDVVKVFHACSEDMEVFKHLWGAVPTPMVDTQIAAGLSGDSSQLSYQRLVEQFLGEHVDKGETRSNWLARPLSEGQKLYAALDVKYLLPVFFKLKETLDSQNRYSWLQEDCNRVIENANKPDDVNAHFNKVKNVWRLSDDQQQVLRALVLWREEEARSRNRPRSFVVKDHSLFDMARQQPNSSSGFSAINELHGSAVRRYLDVWLDIIETVNANLDKNYIVADLPPTKEEKDHLKVLKVVVKDKSESMSIQSDVLAKGRILSQLIKRFTRDGEEGCLPEALKGWRGPEVAEELLSALRAG